MTSPGNSFATRVGGGGVAVLALAVGISWFEMPARGQEPPSFEIQDFGVVPSPAAQMVFLQMEAVQNELKMTDAQKKEQEAIFRRQSQAIERMRGDMKDAARRRVARESLHSETAAALEANLKADQHSRLDQIQLQAQGPLAFARPELRAANYTGPPLCERLKLSGDQVQRVRAIFDQGKNEITKAASFHIDRETKSGLPSDASIRKLVESPEFQASREKAVKRGRDARAQVLGRIEEVLSGEQRASYHRLLGEPFDFSKLKWGQASQHDLDFATVRWALQRGFTFDAKVTRPVYASAQRPPRVLFDEAHHNMHTAGGSYKPFADLLTNDGYEVVASAQKFSRAYLSTGDILIISNALGAAGMGHEEAASPAFTDAECDAVRDWVGDGGALLLIADHAPMGAAVHCMTQRFGVDIRNGSTADPANSEGDETSLVFSRQNHLLGDHPITRGRDVSERVNRVQTFTGTSLSLPGGSVPILKLADTARDQSTNQDKSVSAAGRAQGLAFRFGYGRVVMMGEAAEFRETGLGVSNLDNRQMGLNIMHWLSRALDP